MGRSTRIDYPGAIQLVTNRGTAQTMLFRSDRDRRFFLRLLGELEGRFGVVVIAFVLMGNHYHLIVRSADGRLAEAMHFLDGQYARWFNATHERSGVLFQGRYDARHIESDQSLLRAGAYVHLNPLKAGLVEQPLHYRWSSLPAYAHESTQWKWLQLELLQERSGSEYLVFVTKLAGEVGCLPGCADDDGHRWWNEAPGASSAAETAFAACDRVVAELFGTSIDELYVVVRGRSNVPRMVAIATAAQRTGRSLSDVAGRYGLRSRASVYSAVRRLRELSSHDPQLAQQIDALGLNL